MKIEEIIQKMEEKRIDSIVAVKPENIAYITGFMPSSVAILILNEEPLLLSSKMDMEEALKVSKVPVEEYKSTEDLKIRLKKSGNDKIFVENSMTLSSYLKVFDKFKPNVTDFIESLRIIKSKEEVKKIQGAIKIAENSFKELDFSNLSHITEDNLAAKLEFNMRNAGSIRPAFETIAASGPRSSFPHASSTSKNIESPLMIDWGAHYQNYKSDMTRTLIKNEKEEDILSIVLEAKNEAIKHIQPGVKASYIDKVARTVIEDYGYGDNFIHSTGHGVGLDIHENPSLSLRSEEKLEKGMVVTVEPGIYLEGEFGIRAEDMVLIKNKAKILTNTPQKIFI